MLEVVSLEAKLQREIELRNRYEREMTRPINVHRCTVLKELAPARYQQIQMAQQLKARLELIYRENEKLEERKITFLKEIAKKSDRMKHIRIEDGSYAAQVMRDSIISKDRELKLMEGEVVENRQRIFVMEQSIESLKLHIKQLHVATTAIKRKQREEEIPVLPIGLKFTEQRTRLGGGFDLAQSARTPRPPPDPEEFERRSVRRPAHRPTPASAKVESNVSRKATLTPTPTGPAVTAARSDIDTVRRKPRVSVEKQARTDSSSGKSSARSSRASDPFRPRLKPRTTLIQI
jgi:hypothetical protein